MKQFTASLTSPVQFVPSTDISNPSGMTFDNNGDLWVSNAYGNGSTPAGVYEFSSSGLPMLQAISTGIATPVGLATGPDGNIYGADIVDGDIFEINLADPALSSCIITNLTCPAVSIFITDAGFEPKYLTFAEPEPASLALLGIGLVGFALICRRRQEDLSHSRTSAPSN